ncbi:ATP-binding protein [Dactylosporangium sp. CS-033363]|uniref:ATP-binding protein n=1 Tax=Dactylosporangium sp. CS-033363 TaxID=3239935 RepID=UPI003D8CAD0A
MTRHAALLYDDLGDLLTRLAGTGWSADPVVLACDGAHEPAISALLADRVVLRTPRPDIHSRPAAALAGYRRHASRFGGGATVIAEPDPGETEVAWARAARCEAAANLDPADRFDVVCAYPATAPEPLLRHVIATHPLLLGPGGARPNPGHAEPGTVLDQLDLGMPVPLPADLPVLHAGSSTIADLRGLRELATAHLAGVPTLVRTDFVAALNEILTNAYLHGAPTVELTMWVGAETVEARVTDHGRGRPDAAAGYRARPGAGRAGAGLWLARQACDDIDMWREDGTFTVRAATGIASDRDRQISGAMARAETAHTRAALAAHRTRTRPPVPLPAERASRLARPPAPPPPA